METQVFMPQECSTTSIANPQPGGLQSRTTRLMLLLISVLLLLIVGMVGLYIFMHIHPTVEEINHANCTQRINFTEDNAKKTPKSSVFEVQQSGTYIIHGTEKRMKNDNTSNSCIDKLYLLSCWETATNCTYLKTFFSNETSQEAMIVATGVELKEKTEVFVQRNCQLAQRREYHFIVVKVA
ncbi:hypothetical protein AMEX_G1411 [Astyanax mexicanus]|uniref:Uncharacterized protein n=1 Tax=Astyanax mexicanus TaxID=7994 RepID=A0A8T2MF91_ASTMX|nr:hypothetical protein AMEX_G1411 [Astyanax mexicanus]